MTKSSKLKEKAKKIKLLILDVDGVLTDGSIILNSDGKEIKSFHVRDGHGVKMAQKAGIEVAIVSGRNSKVVELRAEELGITEVYQGIHKKSSVYEALLKRCNLKDKNVAFMGDDIVDIELFKRAGLSAVPKDADDRVKRLADFVSTKEGGRGAVRELIEFILKSSNRLEGVSGESLG